MPRTVTTVAERIYFANKFMDRIGLGVQTSRWSLSTASQMKLTSVGLQGLLI